MNIRMSNDSVGFHALVTMLEMTTMALYESFNLSSSETIAVMDTVHRHLVEKFAKDDAQSTQMIEDMNASMAAMSKLVGLVNHN